MASWTGVPRLDGVRVLVVEDVPAIRELVARALAECGAEVTTAQSAVEGLTLLQEESPDACLTSLSMPGEDGYWLIRQIRGLPLDRGRATLAAAFTGYSTDEDRQDVLRAGFHVHLPKPMDLPALIEAIALLAQRPARHDLEPAPST